MALLTGHETRRDTECKVEEAGEGERGRIEEGELQNSHGHSTKFSCRTTFWFRTRAKLQRCLLAPSPHCDSTDPFNKTTSALPPHFSFKPLRDRHGERKRKGDEEERETRVVVVPCPLLSLFLPEMLVSCPLL
ncbi:unnamed protein product [Pleuronectes platessa]|uniref:Uncharacterized protein n=1 Tax=Pleuronectes platessa TaxID=8262 RepID=A0A9N7V7X3_PLEPL|nr:unnamed protein product [Pleuronectes platessa]